MLKPIEGIGAPDPTESAGLGRDRRRALLTEAAMELNARGVGQASLGDVAARLGVTRTALYNYVEDQRDLVYQCYRHSCEVLARTFTRARQRHEDALDCLDDFIERMSSADAAQIAAITDLIFLDDEQRDTIVGLLSGIIAEVGHVIESGIKTGKIRPCESIIVARAVLAFVSWPPLLPPTNPELMTVAGPNLLTTTKSLLRWGIAAKREAIIDVRHDLNVRTDEPLTNVFERAAVAKAKKEALLAKGSRLLNLKGADMTSLDEIAASVGVSKAVIYHNIGDKQTFVLECYRRAYRFALDTANRMEASKADRATALTTAMYDLALAHLREDAPLLFPVVGFASVSETIVSETREINRTLLEIYERAVQAGIAEGSLQDHDAASLIAMLPASIQWLDKWRSIPSGSDESNELTASEIARLVNVGLSPLGAKRIAAGS
jgi:AcrR family transcriptional regulator